MIKYIVFAVVSCSLSLQATRVHVVEKRPEHLRKPHLLESCLRLQRQQLDSMRHQIATHKQHLIRHYGVGHKRVVARKLLLDRWSHLENGVRKLLGIALTYNTLLQHSNSVNDSIRALTKLQEIATLCETHLWPAINKAVSVNSLETQSYISDLQRVPAKVV